jgi:small neutral amino acid transporter SnatA (MarC family)
MSTIGANDLTEEGRRTVVITIVFTVLATVAVIARFWARFLSALTLQVEDWLIFGGLIFTWGYAAGNIIC